MVQVSDPSIAFEALVGCDVAACHSDDAVALIRSIKHVRGWIDRFEADLTRHLAALYEQGVGAPAAELHARSHGMSAAEARKKERRANALGDAPSFGDALANGDVGAEHADGLASATARLDDATKAAFIDHEKALLDEAKHSSPEEFSRHCRGLVSRLERDQGVERAEEQRRDTHLSRRIDRNGMHLINGALHPELGAAVFGAIDAEVAKLVAKSGDRTVDRNRLAAEALGDLVTGGHRATRPGVAEISVLIDLATLTTGLHENSVCEYDNGVPLPPVTVRRLCCEGKIIPIVLNGDGVPVDVGREQRLANRAQRRALRAMYRTCAFSGCDVAFNRCEIHHLLEWDHRGPTDLNNMLPLCSHHHHLVHEADWQLHLAADRTLTIRQPDGRTFATAGIQIGTAARADRSRARRSTPRDEQGRDRAFERSRQPDHQSEPAALP